MGEFPVGNHPVPDCHMNAAVLSPAPKCSGTLDRVLVSAFLENVPDFVYFKDRESRFLALSGSLVSYFGCKHESEVIGKSDSDFFSANHARPALEDEQRIVRTGQPLMGKIEKETWPDGRVT